MKQSLFLVVLLVILCGYAYIFIRLWQIIPSGNLMRPLLVIFAVLAVASFPVVVFAGEAVPLWLGSALYRLGSVWFVIAVYLLIIFLAADLLKLTSLPVKKFMQESWLGFSFIAAAVTIVLVAGYINYTKKERIGISVVLDKDCPSGQIKIVALSDLHLGYGIGEKEVESWVDLINAEQPDAVLISGDIIDSGLKPLAEKRYAEIFGKIKSRYGVFACLGNHEYLTGITGSLEFLEKWGITILRDSALLVGDEFYVVGRDDMTNEGRQSLTELTSQLDKSKPLILLDHQPNNLTEAEEVGVDIQISGHTHRGQVWPITWITDAIFPLSHGYMRQGNTHFFVSSGIGVWGGKFRIGSKSDYGVITITFK